MLGNCLGWVTYAFLIENYFVYVANVPGFLLSIWLNLCAAKLQYQEHFTNETRKSIASLFSDGSSTFDQNGNDHEKRIDINEEETQSSLAQRAADVGKVVLQVTSHQTPAPAPHEKLVVGISIVWTVILSVIGFGNSFSKSTREYVVGIAVNLNLVFFYFAPLSTIIRVLRSRNSASIHLPTMFTNTANASFWTAYAFAVNDPFIYVPNGIGVLLGVIQFILYLVFPRHASSDDGDNSAVPEDEQECREQKQEEQEGKSNGNEQTTGDTGVDGLQER